MTLDFSRCRLVPVTHDDGAITLDPPFLHVCQGVEWLVNKRESYALLGNDMGGSKSAQAVIAAQFLFEANIIDRVIVVAPAAVRPRVWFSEELGQLGEHLRDDLPSLVTEYHQRIRQWRRGPAAARALKIIATNYEWIRAKGRLAGLLPYCGPRTLLILDESSSVKGHKSAQTEACMQLRWKKWGMPRAGFIWLLNGTPLADGPEDLFSQGNLMHPGILDCRYITHFRARYAVIEPVKSKSGRVLTTPNGFPLTEVTGWKKEGLEDLQRRFAPHVLRQDWRANADLPPAMPTVVLSVPLTAATWKIYRHKRDDAVHFLGNGQVSVSRTAANKVLRLAQITSGLLGGIEDGQVEDTVIEDGLLDSLWGVTDGDVLRRSMERLDNGEDPSVREGDGEGTEDRRVARGPALIGSEKIDFLLAWQADRLAEDPNLKLLVWCRWVEELRRYLHAARERFNHPVGAVCGQLIFEEHVSVKRERETAERLLHPRTADPGPATVGGTYGSGGLGLNFTAFHVVFNLSQIYEPWKRSQADKRVDRPGQKHTVVQYDLVAEGPKGQKTIDHVVMAARKAKNDLNTWTAAAWATALKEE